MSQFRSSQDGIISHSLKDKRNTILEKDNTFGPRDSGDCTDIKKNISNSYREYRAQGLEYFSVDKEKIARPTIIVILLILTVIILVLSIKTVFKVSILLLIVIFLIFFIKNKN